LQNRSRLLKARERGRERGGEGRGGEGRKGGREEGRKGGREEGRKGGSYSSWCCLSTTGCGHRKM